MIAFIGDLITIGWPPCVVGAVLLVGVVVFTLSDPDDEGEDEGPDEGAAWDRGHDQWVDEQNGVGA